MKKWLISLLLALLLLTATTALAGPIVNLIDDPDAEYTFAPDATLLEVIYPPITGSDAAILRWKDIVWMIDGSGLYPATRDVMPVLRALGVKQIDLAFNTHPHDDHIRGFTRIVEKFPIRQLAIAFPEGTNYHIRHTVGVLRETGTKIVTVQDGDVLTLGEVTAQVIQRDPPEHLINDRSACLMIRYGDCTLLNLADVENRGQAALLRDPPTGGLKADIIKYPHHGHARMNEQLFKQIDPQLAVMTAVKWFTKSADKFLARMGVPSIPTRPGPLRFRTDGVIWVLDYLPMEGTAEIAQEADAERATDSTTGTPTSLPTDGNDDKMSQVSGGEPSETPIKEVQQVEQHPVFVITMEDGREMKGELYPEIAPQSVGNFITLANSGFYDGLIFHRVIPGFMIQGGDPKGTGMGGPGYSIKGEFAQNGVPNDLKHTYGVLSMARSGMPDSAGSQFFIMTSDSPHLDGAYAAFGKVLSGMEVAEDIVNTQRDRQDRPLTEQKIKTIRVDTFGQTYSFDRL